VFTYGAGGWKVCEVVQKWSKLLAQLDQQGCEKFQDFLEAIEFATNVIMDQLQ
jgi:hypothetical protein